MNRATPTSNLHEYAARVVWQGNLGEGTASYTSYSRAYRVLVEGKPELEASSDPMFRGVADKHNPEDLFLASLSACHMLFFLSLCARNGVRVTAYEDHATGTLAIEPAGGGRFTEVTLRPVVTVTRAEDERLARELHDAAHERCFIANSCIVPIRHQATVRIEPRIATHV